ncbi:hypothetical protein [Serratia fonticola]|uniref:hypothetical protein n=1 Tax=Serratia fonticola TaxID=47917 RepID=UPI0009404885|nr:hypothetical protein [Serratia fonticola]OKP23409.1 hypothetical protein BSQ40_24720 [Serratia fonticola]
MQKIYRFIDAPLPNEDSGVKFGGGAFIEGEWPKNPIGEDLTLLLTIDSDKLNERVNTFKLPEGKYISVFSTYNENRYFLDDVVFFGDDVELNYIKSGFTRVTLSESSKLSVNSNNLNCKNVKLEVRELDSSDYPAFSFLSNEIPKGMVGYESLLSEYNFICQLYSADIPSEDGGVLGLSDAVGYLFLKKEIEDYNDAGLFFVQTA